MEKDFGWSKYEVRLSSLVPGISACSVTVFVTAEDSECAKERALGKVTKGFPEETRSEWAIEGIRVVQ